RQSSKSTSETKEDQKTMSKYQKTNSGYFSNADASQLAARSVTTVFLMAVWHMSHNFMLKDRELRTVGIFKMNREDAYRFSEYIALGSFLLLDILFVYAFL
ncbi:hypothetical protein M1345_02365, partial [Patescibacteria group bacterium]|nr:hypothetical protein [Patescibacteria group bacterium]